MKKYRGQRTERGLIVTVIDGETERPLDPRLDLRMHADSFETGYAGSGPCQLALALAADVLQDAERAKEVHMQLKFKLTARIPQQDFEICECKIRETIELIEQGG